MMKEIIVPTFVATLVAILMISGVFFTACTLRNPNLWNDILQNEHYIGSGAEEGRDAAYIDSY